MKEEYIENLISKIEQALKDNLPDDADKIEPYWNFGHKLEFNVSKGFYEKEVEIIIE